jgi:hypothetical protein
MVINQDFSEDYCLLGRDVARSCKETPGFEETYCLHLQDRTTLKIEAVGITVRLVSSKLSGAIFQKTIIYIIIP